MTLRQHLASDDTVLRVLQLRMLSVAYNNLAVGLFGMGLASDLPALQLLIDRAAATVRANTFVSTHGTPRSRLTAWSL